jgi:DNA polymerase
MSKQKGEVRSFLFDEEELAPRKRAVNTKRGSKRTSGSSTPTGVGCPFCDLKDFCLSPMMEPFGKNKLKILLVGEAPGKWEDKKGRPFIGEAGKTLRNAFSYYGINIDKDCLTTNVVQCRPRKNEFPGIKYTRHCAERLRKQIEEANPTIIYALGQNAIIGLLLDAPSRVKSLSENLGTLFFGKVVPSRLWDCWIVCCYHPSYINRVESKVLSRIFLEQIGKGFEYYKEPLPTLLDDNFEGAG